MRNRKVEGRTIDPEKENMMNHTSSGKGWLIWWPDSLVLFQKLKKIHLSIKATEEKNLKTSISSLILPFFHLFWLLGRYKILVLDKSIFSRKGRFI